MVRKVFYASLGLMVVALLTIPGGALAQSCADEKAHAAAVSDAELTAEVPELDELHEVVFEIWHDAFPDKNCALIKELLPRADALTAKLDAAKLPGILRDKQATWDEGKQILKAALEALHAAADADDEAGMLAQTEAYHAAFERLIRTIRPLVPELDAFHQELYKLYHYYAPEYDLENIRAAAEAMKDRIPPLVESQLPKRLTERQETFDAAVKTLSKTVDELVETAKKDDKDAILAAVERVHTAYQGAEHVFD